MEYPEKEAIVRLGNLSVVRQDSGHLCGYCRLPRLLAEAQYEGIVTYVPVHGGITYAVRSDTDQMVYGFDCAHVGDESNPLTRDPNWVLAEAKCMETGIAVATVFEPFYLAMGEKGRAFVLDVYHWTLRAFFGIDFGILNNFGAMLRLLSGRL